MSDQTANPNSTHEYSPGWFRFLEILPGAAVWFVLLAPIILAFFIPDAVIIFVLVFDLYWLFKSLAYAVILVGGYYRFKKTVSTDWQNQLARLKELPNPSEFVKNSEDIYHAVLLPTYRETFTTLETSMKSLINGTYPNERLIVVLATEVRGGEESARIAQKLHDLYKDKFFRLLITEHPDDIPGEAKAKGPNVSWAARQLSKIIDAAKIDPRFVIVTTADGDSRFSEQYFWRLTYLYCTAENPVRSAFQPVAMYFNNIWDAPIVSRVLAFGTTFWYLIESMRPYRLVTFATHAMSMQTLRDIDFWCTSIINEDSRQYYRAFFHYDGDFTVIPMFMPVYMDAVESGNWKKSLRNIYLQQQRWAYGTEHFPYIVLESAKRHKIPVIDRMGLVWRAFEGNFSWATASYFITITGWLPFLESREFSNHVLALNYQSFTRNVLVFTWIGLCISIYTTLKLIPPRPEHKHKWSVYGMIVQWIIVPFTAFFFGAIPAIDAQTRLMFGKYIGFRVTEKATSPTKAAIEKGTV